MRILSLALITLVLLASCTPAPAQTVQPTLVPAATQLPVPTTAPTLPPLKPTLAPSPTPEAGPASPGLTSLAMIDARQGWATEPGRVLHTADGGATWQEVTPPELAGNGTPVTTDFLDAAAAWVASPAASDARLFATQDAGKTWQAYSIGFPASHLQFISPRDGYAMADLGAAAGSQAVDLYRTADGGATWTLIAQAKPQNAGAPGALPFGGDKSGFAFSDLAHGWVTGSEPVQGSAYLFRTTDGGGAWERQPLSLPPAYATGMLSIDPPRFFNPLQGILPVRVTADASTLLFFMTQDGGATWTASSPAHATGLYSIPSSQDIVIFDGTTLTVSQDGGRTWASQKAPLTDPGSLIQVVFVDPQTGWAVTPSELYRTEDGGKTWQPASPASAAPGATLAALSPGALTQILGLDTHAGLHLLVAAGDSKQPALAVLTFSGKGSSWSGRYIPGAAPHWTGDPGGPTEANQVAYLDTQHGFIYGPGLFVTEDGGQTWKNSGLGEGIISLAPRPDGSVWALARRCTSSGSCSLEVLAGSANPGSWQPLPGFSPQPAGGQAALLRASGEAAYVLAQDLTGLGFSLWMTSDSGTTWVSQPLPCTVEARLSADPAGRLWLLCGEEPSAGNQMKQVYISTDRGRTWQPVPELPTYGYADAILAISPTQAVIGLGRGTLIETQDTGQTWSDALPLETANPGSSGGWQLARSDESGQAWAAVGTQLFTSPAPGQPWEPYP